MPPQDRRAAARAHLAVFGLGLGLALTLPAWRRRDRPFSAHHGRQATLMIAAIHVLIAAHGVLHLMLAGVLRLQAWAATEAGSEAPGWALAMLDVLLPINWGAMAIELLVALALAVRQARRAARGERGVYFFLEAFTPTGS